MSWQAKVEAGTLVTADNHREVWETEDLEFVAAFRDDESDESLAYALGRSYYAITAIKRVLDERLTKEVAARAAASRQRTYTFIDGDVPEDW
jgi:hypothetical protein